METATVVVPAQAGTQLRPIGLLGGSFDPIHRGHLALARDAIDQLDLAELRFVPAGQPWQKGRIADAQHRLRMLERALQELPPQAREKTRIDPREIDRSGASYTIDTLRELRAELGPERSLVLVMGSDQFQNLQTWRNWRALADFAHIAIARRNDAVIAVDGVLQEFANERWTDRSALALAPSGRICEIVMTPVDASSTEVRQLLAAPAGSERDARLAALVPAAVLDYIHSHDLYR